MARTILLTGGSGFIGSNFVRFVLEHRDDSIINLDALTYSGNPENLSGVEENSRYRFVHGDINDPELLATLIAESDVVVHMAAESHVDRSINDPRPFIDANVVGTQTVLEAVRRAERDVRVLYVSTDEVYGALPLDDPTKLFTEESPIAPNSPYAASKAAGDLMARAYHHTFGLDVVTTRCSNNFGPYQFPEKVIPLFVTNLMQGEKVPLYGDGLNVRDWLHVDDHCEAILRVLDDAKPGAVYNIGGNNERSNLESDPCHPRGDGRRRVDDQAGRRSPRPRPPLRHRRVEDRGRLGLAAVPVRLARRLARHDQVVSGQRDLVAARPLGRVSHLVRNQLRLPRRLTEPRPSGRGHI